MIVLIAIFLITNHISSKNAINTAKLFCAKAGLHLRQEPSVEFLMPTLLGDSFALTKSVVITDENGNDGSVLIYFNNKNSIRYINHGIRSKASKKYKLPLVGTDPLTYPDFLPESKAKKNIFNISDKIGIPDDFEFTEIRLNKMQGTWYGLWTRKYSGFAYENDSILIQIMAMEGEFYTFSKTCLGSPCLVDVKVTKEEAIAKGWEKIGKYFDDEKWKTLKKEYEVKAAELKIIQPNVFLGFVISMWKNSDSRLAWVIEYAPIKEPDADKRLEIGYHDRFVIKIDAATKDFLGGITGMYK